MRLNKTFAVIAGVSFCALLGTCVKPTTKESDQMPTRITTPVATYTVAKPEPTATESSANCDRNTWSTNTSEVLQMMPDAITLDLVDALITKYDAIRMPYKCDYADIADDIDTKVRMALGARRSAYTIGNPDMYLQEAEMYTIEATRLLTTYVSMK